MKKKQSVKKQTLVEKIEVQCGDPLVPGNVCIPMRDKPTWGVSCAQCHSLGYEKGSAVKKPLWLRIHNKKV